MNKKNRDTLKRSISEPENNFSSECYEQKIKVINSDQEFLLSGKDEGKYSERVTRLFHKSIEDHIYQNKLKHKIIRAISGLFVAGISSALLCLFFMSVIYKSVSYATEMMLNGGVVMVGSFLIVALISFVAYYKPWKEVVYKNKMRKCLELLNQKTDYLQVMGIVSHMSGDNADKKYLTNYVEKIKNKPDQLLRIERYLDKNNNISYSTIKELGISGHEFYLNCQIIDNYLKNVCDLPKEIKEIEKAILPNLKVSGKDLISKLSQ